MSGVARNFSRRNRNDSDSDENSVGNTRQIYSQSQNVKSLRSRKDDDDDSDESLNVKTEVKKGIRGSSTGRSSRDDYDDDGDGRNKFRNDDDEEEEGPSIIRKRQSSNNNNMRRSVGNSEGNRKTSWDNNDKPSSSFTPKEVSKLDSKESAIDYMKKFNGQNKKNVWANGGTRLSGSGSGSLRSSFQEDDVYKSDGKISEGQKDNVKWNSARNSAMNASQLKSANANGDEYEDFDSRGSASEFRRGSDEENIDFGDDDVVSNPKAMQNTSFAEYADEAEKNGQTLPRRSGRYDEAAKSTSGSGDSKQDEGNSSNFLPKSLLPSQAIVPSISTSKSFVHVAHRRGTRTEQVQCVIVRDRSSMTSKLYPAYTLILEETKKPLIIAKKMNMNRTSNYHLFDMTRGQAGSKLTKKSGNYLGKLRSKNVQSTEYVLVGQNSEREEFAGVLFDRLSIVTQMKEGSQPRKMTLVVPELGEDDTPSAHRVYDEDTDAMSEMLKQRDLSLLKGVHVLESKEPVYENGNYRLNFHGRVSIPSVKNFQLVSPNDIDDIICQFGKVGEDKFHLDYKAPLNAFQAFSLALCQFNV